MSRIDLSEPLKTEIDLCFRMSGAERIKALESLVRDMHGLLDETCDTYFEDDYHRICERMSELGIEVEK